MYKRQELNQIYTTVKFLTTAAKLALSPKRIVKQMLSAEAKSVKKYFTEVKKSQFNKYSTVERGMLKDDHKGSDKKTRTSRSKEGKHKLCDGKRSQLQVGGADKKYPRRAGDELRIEFKSIASANDLTDFGYLAEFCNLKKKRHVWPNGKPRK